MFSGEERESILANLDYYTTDEAATHINWVLAELPRRKEQERKEAAAELYQVVTLNFTALGEEQARLLYSLCNSGQTPAARLWQLKEEIVEQLTEEELSA